MYHALLPGVEHEPLAAGPSAIEPVANDGVTRVCEMNANLMLATREQLYLQERPSVGALQRADERGSRLSATETAALSTAPGLPGV